MNSVYAEENSLEFKKELIAIFRQKLLMKTQFFVNRLYFEIKN